MTSKFRPSHLISWPLRPDTLDNRHVLEVVVSHSLVSRDGIIGMVCEYHQNTLGQFFKTSSSGIEIKSLSGMIVGRSSVLGSTIGLWNWPTVRETTIIFSRGGGCGVGKF